MNIFTQFTIIIVIAAGMTAVMRLLKQPLIIGHIITGLIAGPYVFNIIQLPETLTIFSKFGIALLLFIVGLSLSPQVIKEIGKTALIIGLGQIMFTALVGFAIIYFIFHFSFIEAVYISIALTFSSTIIVLKLLSDKGDLQKLYARIAIGFLLIQDIAAAFILIIIPSLQKGVRWQELIIIAVLKGIILSITLIFTAIYLLPRLSRFFAESQECLFLFSIAWGLGLASLFYKAGFSLEIGALSAGVALSISPYHREISSKTKPLRDFFIIIFFITLGSGMALADLKHLLVPALGLSLFVLIGNPLIVMILMGALGYTKKVSFFAGLAVAQISEFSLILIVMAVQFGHLNQEILSLVTLIGLMTIAGSAYMILHAEQIYPRMAKFLSVFERKNCFKNQHLPSPDCEIILFGYNRIGYDFLRVFNKLNKKFLVVDFDPEVIGKLNRQKINCHYGDVDDGEFLDELNLSDLQMAVSTIPDFETNAFLIERIRKINKGAIIMVISHNLEDAEKLYERGASYVIMPHFLGGRHASLMIQRNGFNRDKFDKIRAQHIKHLRRRKALGHEHPIIEK